MGLADRPAALLAIGAAAGGVVAAMFIVAYQEFPDAPTAQLVGPAVLAVGCAFFALYRRYEVTLAVLLLYLGLVDGYVKLKTNDPQVTLIRDALFYAVIAGVLVRLAMHPSRPQMPKWTPYVAAFVVVTLLQLLNPYNFSLSSSVQGLRPHLEWVPLFFFGFVMLRRPEP